MLQVATVTLDAFIAKISGATRALLSGCSIITEGNHIYIGCNTDIVSYRLLKRATSIANVANRLQIGVTICDTHRRMIELN